MARAAVWDDGLRPFYLLGAFDFVASLVWWAASLAGWSQPLSSWWHGAEMIFGGSFAIAAGFLTTAVPKWTDRAVFSRAGLVALTGLWILSRAEHYLGGTAYSTPLFMAALTIPIGLAIVRNGVTRQIILVAILALAILASLCFITSDRSLALWLAVCAFVLLISMIGARVVPTFINNARPDTAARSAPRFLEIATILITVAALALLADDQTGAMARVFCFAAFTCHSARMFAWGVSRARGNALLAMLPLAYAWIPAGFLIGGLSQSARMASLHAFTAGAMATMMIAMMIRSARGHTGRALAASSGDKIAFALVYAGAVLRTAFAMGAPGWALLPVSALLLALAFVVFIIAHTRPLLSPRHSAPTS